MGKFEITYTTDTGESANVEYEGSDAVAANILKGIASKFGSSAIDLATRTAPVKRIEQPGVGFGMGKEEGIEWQS